MSEERAVQIWQEAFNAKQTILKFRNALAGDGGGTVDVSGEPGFIWCRYSADQSKVSKVFNIIAPGLPEDFPIVVGRRFPSDEFEQVLAVNWTLYQDTVTQDTVDNFTTGHHGESHNAASGADPAPIDLRNIVEMRGRAQDTPDLTISIERTQYIFGDTVKRYPGENLDLTASVPAVAGHRLVLVYVDSVANAASSTDGTIVPLAAAAPIPDIPENALPVCLVDLEENETTIDEDDIYDWRFLWGIISNNIVVLSGTNAERLALTIGDLAEFTRFYTSDTDKIWEVYEGAWRLIYPPAALSESDGDSGTPWVTNSTGSLIGSEDLQLDDGVSDSPAVVFIGGSNDDEARFHLDDDAVAEHSDIVLTLAGNDRDSRFIIWDLDGNSRFQFTGDGDFEQLISDAVTNTVTTYQLIEHQTSGTVADGFGSQLLVRLEDDGGAMEDAAAITFEWEDATSGTEDTLIRFWLRKAGAALGPFIEFGATENVFNESSADIDFRVESDGQTHMLFVDGGTDRVGIGESSPDAIFHVTSSSVTGLFERSNAGLVAFNHFYNPDTTDNNGCVLDFFTDTDGVGATVDQLMARIMVRYNQHDHATRESRFQFQTSDSGAASNKLIIQANGDVWPGSAKAQDLGSTSAEWDVIYYVTATTGTSRLVDSTRTCPVCAAQMKRGTGTINVQGEDADYALVFCIACGVAGVEEWSHLPANRLSERLPPPQVVFEGMRVKSHGRSRTVTVAFRYGDDVGDDLAIRNSTTLSDAELASFLTMNEQERNAFLLQLGEREWYAREEQRIMRDERDILQAQLDALTTATIGVDLLE